MVLTHLAPANHTYVPTLVSLPRFGLGKRNGILVDPTNLKATFSAVLLWDPCLVPGMAWHLVNRTFNANRIKTKETNKQ